MSVQTITENQKAELKLSHDTFSKKAYLAGYSQAAASFLIIGALIVITSACLCLTIPGVSLISDVILPGVVPGGAALLLSIPLLIAAVKLAHEKKRLREAELDTMIGSFEQHKLSDFPAAMDEKMQEKLEKKKANFIYKNFMPSSWTKEYRTALVTDLKKRFPEEGDNKTVHTFINNVLDEVKTKIGEEGIEKDDEDS